MYNRVFLDANILADIYDETRISHKASLKSIQFLSENSEIELFSSCDIITTIYYILSKKDKKIALDMIISINDLCNIIDFSNYEITQSCNLMKKDSDYIDLEDTLQYILAKKVNCDLIISNDNNFISKDIELLNSLKFCEKFNIPIN